MKRAPRVLRCAVLCAAFAGAPGCNSSSSSPPPAPVSHSCTLALPAPATWRLHADGTLFKDDLGRVVLLRGVDAGGRSKFAPFVPFDYPDGGYATALTAYMDHAAGWGIDAMRVPFTWEALEPTQGQDDQDWLSRFDQLVQEAWKHRIWVVLDFHQDIYSDVFCGDGFPGWTVPDAGPPHHDCTGWSFEYFSDPGVQGAFDRFWAPGSPVQAEYLAVWDKMIARYKDMPGVIGFEPMNEPAPGTADNAAFSATTLTTFYSSMVPHMRAAAPQTLVFVDPSGLDGADLTTSLMKPTGDGIVFAPHYYPIGGGGMNQLTGLTTWSTLGASWNTPVFVGEFGATNLEATNTDYMKAVFDALDALGLSGTQWEYSVSPEVWNGELFGLTGPDGGDLDMARAVQRPFARAVAGAAVAESFDTASHAFALSYTAASGVTEVSVPASVYPSGYVVDVAGGCVDTTTAPGEILLQADPAAPTVTLKLTTK